MSVCKRAAAEKQPLCTNFCGGYKQIQNKDQVYVCWICVWLNSNMGGVEWLQAAGAVKYATCM